MQRDPRDKLQMMSKLIANIKILFISTCFIIYGCYTPKDYYNKKIKPIVIKAKLISKYKDTAREYPRIIIADSNRQDTITLINNLEIWEYLLPGDSILKDEGSLQFTIIRDGNRNYFDLKMDF